jgi:adenylate cyclase
MDKVRINAQLSDVTTGQHLWAERYDRDLNDLFALQDEIIQTIVITLALKIDRAERARAVRKDTESLEAYDYLLRGWQHYNHGSRSENREARQSFQRAIELDPRYASAYVALAWSYLWDISYGATEFPNQALQRAHDLAKKALSFDESNAGAHFVLGTVYVRRKQFDLATSELQRAIELNPNDPRAREDFGDVMLYTGRTDNAIHFFETALRFNPNLSPGSFMNLGLAYYLEGRYPEAIKTVKTGMTRNPDFAGYHIVLAAAYAKLGHQEDAKRSAALVLKLNPFFEIDSYGSIFSNPDDREKIVDGLNSAGLQ